ncbi:hypothetical protein M408DRAFT_332922 [Serendipita vermifera MAFF 305830]|uniref:Uncharacterized protein n=1 Tax=Serendipita vermifera MAFF 305830 TaxID=933852 RepID=A0A0C2W7H1_SERVB|nr:hypothetical protein M408DRAFT_332922 [Serendipita vermifera MAFF 305830]
MREPFLFYEEKVQTTAEEKQAKADRRARKASSSDSQAASAAALQPIRRQDRPSKPDGLTKQTYSSYVTLDPSLPSSSPFNQQPSQRKWHCVAYFSAADWNNLPSVDAYVNLRNIVVPDGVYTSTKGTGKSGSSYATDEVPTSAVSPAVSSAGAASVSGGRVGPIRRPMSRGTLSSSPYTSGGRPSEGSLGPASPCSASSTSDDPRSPGSVCDSPVSYHAHRSHAHPAHTAYHQQQQQQQVQQQQQQSLHPHSSFPHHHHSSSTSSASTGSPPTPGFMSSIPSPSSFNSTSSSSSSSRTAHAHGRHTDDVIMIDAPTLRTPTKDHPHHHHNTHMHQQPHRRSGDGKPIMDVEHFATSPTTGAPSSGASLPSFSTILGQSRAAGPSGRSREDSMALGAFRLAL